MVLDNLFIVQSPLQALVAAELSLQFEGQNNGVIYRLAGKGRELNDKQMLRVIKYGNWCFQEPVAVQGTGAFALHISLRRHIAQLKKRFRNKVRTLFFGEFRSQWMHFARFAIAPEQSVLMDDGAATLTVKHKFIDRDIYYPEDLWANTSFLKKAVKDTIYFGLVEKVEAQKPITFASAFLKEESAFKVDFSSVRRSLTGSFRLVAEGEPKAYFFGSKYSEVGILSQNYELNFITDVIDHYRSKRLDVVYCAHRDESEKKLDRVRRMKGLEVVRPDLPAELFLLERDADVAEIGAAYSSVINNLGLMFPDKAITSFRLDSMAVNPKNRKAIDHIYTYFEQEGVRVKYF